MYLEGMAGSMAIRMPDGTVRTVSAIRDEFAQALAAGGQPLRPNGEAYAIESFAGGYLFDECPGNVILGEGWLPGQQELLRAAGKTRCLPAAPPAPPPAASGGVSTYTGAGTGASGGGRKARFPTGMATPTIVNIPGLPPTMLAPPEEPRPAVPAGDSSADWMPWVIGGGLALLLLRR